jgi:tRNA pseudouridine55 synthase
VDVYSLTVLRYEYPEVDLDIRCGSGTYIRTLGIDLAQACGSRAVMAHLRRHAVGPFAIEQSVTVDQLRDDDLDSMLLPALLGVKHLPSIFVDDQAARRLVNGQPIESEPNQPVDCVEGTEITAVTKHGLKAIVRWRKGAWFPYRVFPDPEC